MVEVSAIFHARVLMLHRPLLDVHFVDNSPQLRHHSILMAKKIQKQIRMATGCDASIGVARNCLLARLATKKAKPCGVYYLKEEEVQSHIDSLPLDSLLGIGRAVQEKLVADFGVDTCGALRALVVCSAELEKCLGGRMGQTVWKMLRGIDETVVASTPAGPLSIFESNKRHERKSIGAEVNWGIRFQRREHLDNFLRELAVEVEQRLVHGGMIGSSFTLKLRIRAPHAPREPPSKYLGCGECLHHSRTLTTSSATGDASKIVSACFSAYEIISSESKHEIFDIRGLGIHVGKLQSAEDAVAGPATLLDRFLMKEPQSCSSSPHLLRDAPNDPVSTTWGFTSKSQVDLQVFEALPPSIQRELEVYWKGASGVNEAGVDLQPETSTRQLEAKTSTRQQKPKISTRQVKAKTLKNVTKAPISTSTTPTAASKSHHLAPLASSISNVAGESPLRLDGEPLDLETLHALPSTIRREFIADLRHQNQQKIAHTPSKFIVPGHNIVATQTPASSFKKSLSFFLSPSPSRNFPQLNGENPASLVGVRSLLQVWFESLHEQSDCIEILSCVFDYLDQLVAMKEFEMASNVVGVVEELQQKYLTDVLFSTVQHEIISPTREKISAQLKW